MTPDELTTQTTKEDADRAETMEARQRMSRAAAGCQTYWPAPYEVCGVIRDKYNQMNGPNSFLLFPKTNELTNPGNTGKRSEFLGGNIYWSPATGAHPVAHDFLTKWGQYGYESGFMKYPTTDEIPLGGDTDGRRQEFQGAYMYYSIPTGTHNVQGALLDKYKALGAQASMLGYPTSDEQVAPDGAGRFNTFQYGSLYWSPSSGAHAVYGGVLEKWKAAGYERGTYGYPVGDTVGSAAGTDSQAFQRGTITAAVTDLGDPPWRRGVDKEVGPNYDDAVECLGGYDNKELTLFNMTGETLMCTDFRHIFEGHFPAVLNPVDWADFQKCVAYTLQSTETGFTSNKPGTTGRTRFNTWSDTRSFVIVRIEEKTIFNAFTDGDGGRNWGGCAQFLLS